MDSERQTEAIAKLRSQLRELTARVKKVETRAAAHEQRLRLFRPHAVEEMLTSLEKDAEYLHKRLQLEVEKICVVTEVAFSARRDNVNRHEVQSAAIWAFDQPDSLWKGLADLELAEVRNRLVSAYRNRVIG